MSAVQAGGGKSSGQKPGGAAGGRPAPGSKPKTSSGPKPAPGRPGPATKTGSGGRSGGGGGKGPKQPGGYKPGAKPPQRFSPSTLAFAAVAIVVVIIVAFVVIKVTSKTTTPGTDNATGTHAPAVTLAPASLVSKVASVPTSVATSVGLPSTNTVVPPTVKKGQPKLVLDGKPGALFIGAEFCPYCAAERWSLIMAFSKFGTFSNLHETTSSPWDSYPATPTFTFNQATYNSSYLTFDPVETESNDTGPNQAGRGTLQPLTKAQNALWAKYDTAGEGFPFLDIGNKVFVTTPSYIPSTLAGLDQADIASKLKNPKDPVTVAIVGTSNYITAGICSITGQQPTSACSPTVIGKAAKAMGLS
jgi:hypothetical protein